MAKKNASIVRLTSLQYLLVGLNLAVRFYSSLYMIIGDCDETFNYWEPLNFLNRKFGKQTWEYSPEFAIRDYLYLLIYYVLGFPVPALASLLSSTADITLPHTVSYYQFYWLRFVALNGITSYAEINLFKVLNVYFSPSIANWFLFFTSIAPGMSHAGVALLPSSFAMQCNLFAISAGIIAISTSDISKYISTIHWFLIGGLIGWPFALALAIPFGLYTLFNRQLWKSKQIYTIIFKNFVGLVLISTFSITVNAYYYKRALFVPLNIVLYNVFGGEGEGPEIFGVEPFSYYILNLLINFNITVLLGYAGVIFNPFLYSTKTLLLTFITSLPTLIWTLVFFSQPHKEERFLYPIYPLISINAAFFTYKIFAFINQVVLFAYGRSSHTVQRFVTRSIQFIFLISVFTVSILRIVNLVENYSSPLTVLASISKEPEASNNHDTIYNVCMGREWYHYPNSFFLPSNYRLKFVKSSFDGLLPGDFGEVGPIKDITSTIPIGMNNKNQFEPDKVVELEECDYYIDNSGVTNGNEPELIVTEKDGLQAHSDWEIITCEKLLNPDGNHSGLAKILYIPPDIRRYLGQRIEYMEFCALKRVNHQ
ncbi:Alg9-like mannosyltransferase family-domain-containing protein [Scheffersomyces amazonensis]|uniref:Alg9-like mannosyltransferase family-domain-containing protein n=1 Tax=Scheffersomyces amazonensis TaxID=1078765 RepID=UPI00315C7677